MRKLVVFAFLLLQPFLAGPSSAAPCVSAPLATFTTPGFSCTVGTLDFSGFTILETPAAAQPFDAVSINPLTSAPNEFGLEFVVNQQASAGELFQQLIGYRVTGIGSLVDRSTLLFTGSSTTEDASVTALQQLCVEGIFAGADGVTGCTGSALNQSVIDFGGVADPPIFTDLGPAAFLGVVSDIAVDAGALGDAALTSASHLFRVTAAPAQIREPSPSMLVIIPALLLLLGVRRGTGALGPDHGR
jgi:hypothetical protein